MRGEIVAPNHQNTADKLSHGGTHKQRMKFS